MTRLGERGGRGSVTACERPITRTWLPTNSPSSAITCEPTLWRSSLLPHFSRPFNCPVSSSAIRNTAPPRIERGPHRLAIPLSDSTTARAMVVMDSPPYRLTLR